MGDFNVVHFGFEKVGGDLSWLAYMKNFNHCCYDAQVDDLKFSTHLCTWSNKSPGDRLIARKLDRVLVNSSWNLIFPDSEAVFLPPGVSDHCPVVVSTRVELHKRKIPFNFFNHEILTKWWLRFGALL